jgi:hypothetical protein
LTLFKKVVGQSQQAVSCLKRNHPCSAKRNEDGFTKRTRFSGSSAKRYNNWQLFMDTVDIYFIEKIQDFHYILLVKRNDFLMGQTTSGKW